MKTNQRKGKSEPKGRQVRSVFILEFRAPYDDAWLVSVDAMPFTRKDAATRRANAFMQNTPHIHYRVAEFVRAKRERGQ